MMSPRVFLQFAKHQRVGEGLSKALEVDHRAIDSKGCSSFFFIVKDGIWKESFETYDVLVRDVIVESSVVGMNGSLPKAHQDVFLIMKGVSFW